MSPQRFGDTDPQTKIAGDAGQISQQDLIVIVFMRILQISGHPGILFGPERLRDEILEMVPDHYGIDSDHSRYSGQHPQITQRGFGRKIQSEADRVVDHVTPFPTSLEAHFDSLLRRANGNRTYMILRFQARAFWYAQAAAWVRDSVPILV